MCETDEHSCIAVLDDGSLLGLAAVLLLIEVYLDDMALLTRM